MVYTVLATRYRPQNFDELAGQEYTARTLKNAIGGGRVAHAFLFSGLRGCGKTSAARILAKALNCVKRQDANPCNQCGSCRSITEGSALDVVEIDGASNNSVDDIRRLREQVAYRPTASPFRIYIIDEVHMLSGSAFNALLKTLEEPPEHVKFILATTEPQKIPSTVLSRCQRFDFKPIPAGRIAERMKAILETEGLKAEPSVLELLAEAAEGSMRDGLSLLDKMVSAFGSPLKESDVRSALGLVGREFLLDGVEAVLSHDVEACLECARRVYEEGMDIKLFGQAFAQALRDLAVVKVSRQPARLVGCGEADLERMRRMVEDRTPEDIDRVYQNFNARLHAIATDALPRVALEMALVRLALIPPLVPLERILNRLEQIGPMAYGPVAPASAGLVRASMPSPAVAAPPKSRSIRVETAASVAEKPSVGAIPIKERSGDDPSLDDSIRWERFLRYVEDIRPSMASQLMQGQMHRMGEAEVFLYFRKNCTFGKLLSDREKQQEFEDATEAFFGRRFRLNCRETTDSHFLSHQEQFDRSREIEDQTIARRTMEDAGVRNALEAFKGDLVEVTINRLDPPPANRENAR